MKIGLTCGAFDLCHAGHMEMFREAKEECDHLIVMLQEDPSITDASYRGKKKARPIMPLKERYEILRGIKYVDEICTYTTEEDLYDKLKKIPHDIRIIGADWKDKEYTGHDLLVPVYFNSRSHGLSTTELKERIVNRHLGWMKEEVDLLECPKDTTNDYQFGFEKCKQNVKTILK